MHRRRSTLLGATCAALITSAALATPGASVPPDPLNPPTSPADPPIAAGDAVANGSLALPRPAPPRPAPPADASKPLGRPDHALGARPATDEPAAGPLAALDPRRNDFVRVGGALVLVLGLLLLARAGLRRGPGMLGGGGRPAGVVEVLARYPIARGQSLLVMRVARRILLLHHAGTSMVTLSEVADAEEVAAMLARMEAGARAKDASRFRAKLRDFEAEHDRAITQGAPGPGSGPRIALDRGEIVDLTRGSGRRALPGRRRIPA